MRQWFSERQTFSRIRYTRGPEKIPLYNTSAIMSIPTLGRMHMGNCQTTEIYSNDFTLVVRAVVGSLSTSLSVPSSVSSSLRASSVPLTLTAVIPTSLADLTLRPRSSRNTTYTKTTRRSAVKPFSRHYTYRTLCRVPSMFLMSLPLCTTALMRNS